VDSISKCFLYMIKLYINTPTQKQKQSSK